ncbi:uncharacterized protein (DUF342 family) [Evansella vedderi]|uniref:Uncharacterized protein (DUF342 family) n=1 Tax=Evansella vedderi TaxID=38282 RepID=A0ABT9ZQQ5_9BACI|nr:FapA family protein [Evansella vedderi]MDQ0253061.1 uncharacterized protein (DUF342 family) [Evansella vedderi]
MQSVVSKGRNIEEAIAVGLKLLETTKSQVNIEIVQQETKSFWGLRSKEAIVKLTKLDSNDSFMKKENPTGYLDIAEQMIDGMAAQGEQKVAEEEILPVAEANLDGKAWVKDGILHFQTAPSKLPTVTISKGVKLYKNNLEVKGKSEVLTEADTFQLKEEFEERATDWKITFDQHRLKALLHVNPGNEIIRKVKDIQPDHHIKLTVEETKKIQTNLNYDAIIEKAVEMGIRHGFDHTQLIKAMNGTKPGTYEIAFGKEPTPGKNGWIELMVDIEEQEGPKENEDGSVDHREIKTIPTVEKGQVIAIIHPPVPGKAGYTVTNEPLPAKQTFPITVAAGKGIVLVEDRIVSMESGRPQVEKRGQLVRVSIMPKLTIRSDVDMASGNIHFMGDVEILGNVDDNMMVETDGNIVVHKTVNMSTLTASGAVISRGTVNGSVVSAGKNNMIIVELGQILGILHGQTEKVITVIRQLVQQLTAFKSNDFSQGGLKPLIGILLEKKFKEIPPLVKKYTELVKKEEKYLIDSSWKDVATSLMRYYVALSKDVLSVDGLIQLSEKLKELHELSTTPVEPESYITIPNTLNSQLYCSGNITVSGKSCINSKLHAGGKLTVGGILRGGHVYGNLGVEVKEVGAEIGTTTLIETSEGSSISIGKAIEGTVLKIGRTRYSFKETRNFVQAQLNEHGRIVIK